MQFQWMKSRPVFDEAERRLDLLHRLNDALGLHLDDDHIDHRPGFDLQLLNDAARPRALLNVFDWYVAELEAFYAEAPEELDT